MRTSGKILSNPSIRLQFQLKWWTCFTICPAFAFNYDRLAL